MHPNEQLLHQFYTAFQKGDAMTMKKCYHPEVQFRDPVFGVLKGDQAGKMWQMLLEKAKGEIKIEYSKVKADDTYGIAKWRAEYPYSPTKRKVINKIDAEFTFKDGLIYKHTDNFNLWKWAQQAIGWKGYLLGWTSFFQKKTQEKGLQALQVYNKR